MTSTKAPREFWLVGRTDGSRDAIEIVCGEDCSNWYRAIKVVEHSAYQSALEELRYYKNEFESCAQSRINFNDDLKEQYKEIENLSTKLRRTVNAAYHALLEMSAWMGIPEKKREKYINDQMSNVRFCAEHDLRQQDVSQEIQSLSEKLKIAVEIGEHMSAGLDGMYGGNGVTPQDDAYKFIQDMYEPSLEKLKVNP